MKIVKNLYHFLSKKHQTIHLDYKVNVKPRIGMSPNSILLETISKNKEIYKLKIESFKSHVNYFKEINDDSVEKDENLPTWNNKFLPGLDIVSLYGIIAYYKPQNYIEIGSGNSTKVARKSVLNNNLNTKIYSYDPYPRRNIDHLADVVVREPFENSNILEIAENLNENDILFIDNSHRVFPNSDAMVFFMELLPILKKGVIVHVHDVYLPYDYPQFMCDRFYNEQYLLAAFLLSNPQKYETIFPAFFVSKDEVLSQLLLPIWENLKIKNVEKHGGSFWFKINF